MTQPMQGKIIKVPNALRAKVGGTRFSGIDPAALAKAEEALSSLSSQFGQWLQDELAKLDAARSAIHADGLTAQTAEGLYFRAHDLKGLGSTYGYPIITQIAGSLCKLTDSAEKRAKAPLYLIDAHIDAIKAAVRDGVKDDSDPTGKVVLSELCARVDEHLASL